MDVGALQPDLPRALSLVGIDELSVNDARAGKRAPSARELLEWAARTGWRGVALNAAAPGLRARELDRSARRDLAALLRRLNLGFAGLDLFIPPEHFAQGDAADRAISAASGALELAADLGALTGGRAVVTLALPDDPAAAPAMRALADRADRTGAIIADISWPPKAPPPPGAQSKSGDAAGTGWDPAVFERIRIALDPAAVLLDGRDPAMEAARLGRRIASARLSDVSSVGRAAPRARTPPDRPGRAAEVRGRLDEAAYLAALSVSGYDAPVIVDLRGVPNAAAEAEALAAAELARRD